MASTLADQMSWSRPYTRDRRRTYKGRYQNIASFTPEISSSYASTKSSYRSAYKSASPSAGHRSRRDTLDVDDYHSPSTSPSGSRHRSSVSPTGSSYRRSVSPSAARLRATASVDRDVHRSYSASSYVPRYSASVDREVNYEVQQSSSYVPRYSASVDREVNYEAQQSDKYFGVRQPTYNSYSSTEDYSSQRVRPRQSYSLDRAYTRGSSLDRDRNIEREVYDHTSRRLGQYRDYLSESKSYQDVDDSSYDVRSTYSALPRRTRASSVSRIGESIGEYEIVHRTRRASSVSRLDFNQEDERSGPGWQVVLGPCQARTMSTPSYSRDPDHYNYQKSYTIEQNQAYDPDEVEVVVTPSGKKAVSYKRFSQYGHGDPKEASKAFKTVEERTKYLETQMTSLEDFVRKNRSLFPEETTIYQQVRFFQLNAEQLRQIGEAPDAEVYGVKIREKLVVPPGTEIAEILNRHYGQSTDVKVEYSNKASQVQTSHTCRSEETETFAQIQERIRNKVEKEYENRERARLSTHDSYDIQQASKHIYRQEDYEHMHPHITPNYLKSIYVNAGLDYEDHYSRRSGSVPSDAESARSVASRKSKRFDTAPSFTAKLRPKRCMEGQTVRFNCSISGLPTPEIIWFKGSKIINDSARFKVTNNYGLLSLEINNVEREDGGVYSVKALNLEGEVACSAPLEVQEVAPIEETGDGTRKPWFVVEAANSWAEVGGKATIEAQAAGRPMPTFKWQKDNVTIHDSDRHRIYTDQQGNTKLVIQQSKESDTGLYFIIAENKAGVAKCTATLRVADRSMIPESERPRRSLSRETTPVRTSRRSFSRDTTPSKLSERPPIIKGTKPWFIRALPSDVKIRVGDPLSLTCVVDGDPKPKVTWLKGVRELTYDKRKRVVVSGDHHLLEVERMLETEAGQYVVVAENPLGRVSCTCWVNILPRRPEEEEDYDIRRLKLELPEYEYEVTPRGEYIMMRPRFTKKLPLEQELAAGGNLEIKCKVKEGHPQYVKTGVDIDVNVIKPGGITEEIITLTKQGDDVIVKEVKKRDWLEAEERERRAEQKPVVEPESRVTPKPAQEAEKEKPSELEGDKPVFTTALVDKTVKLDSIAKLSVKIAVRPEPKVQWSKDGNNIKDGGRYEVFEEDGMYHLEVYDVEATDGGAYQCCATNDIGSATCSCILTIAGGDVQKKEAIKVEDHPEDIVEEIIVPVKAIPLGTEGAEPPPKKDISEDPSEFLKEYMVDLEMKGEIKPKAVVPMTEIETTIEPVTEVEIKEEPLVSVKEEPVESKPKEPSPKKEEEEESTEEPSESEKESSAEPAVKKETKAESATAAKEEPAEPKAKEPSPKKEKEAESTEEPSESEKESSVEPSAKEEIKAEPVVPVKEEPVESKPKEPSPKKEEEAESTEEPSESEKESSAEPTVKKDVKQKEPETQEEVKPEKSPEKIKSESEQEGSGEVETPDKAEGAKEEKLVEKVEPESIKEAVVEEVVVATAEEVVEETLKIATAEEAVEETLKIETKDEKPKKKKVPTATLR